MVLLILHFAPPAVPHQREAQRWTLMFQTMSEITHEGGEKGKLSLVIVPWNSWFSRNSIQLIKEAFLLCFWASNVTSVSKMEMDLGRLT